MDFIRISLEQQPLMALFLTTAVGYLLGELSIRGFSLGVGAVLFVALGVGWFAPKAGSGTSTPALQAAIGALGNDGPAVGYSVAYPSAWPGPFCSSF